jgi:hypothetical protein
MIHRELGVAIGEVLDLLLLGDNLLVEEVDLLGGHRVIGVLSLLSRGRCFSANVIERLFAVRPEFRVLEFPRLFCVRGVPSTWTWGAYILPVWRLAIFLVILANLVEVVLVQLAYETGEVAVLEVLR